MLQIYCERGEMCCQKHDPKYFYCIIFLGIVQIILKWPFSIIYFYYSNYKTEKFHKILFEWEKKLSMANSMILHISSITYF